MNFYSVTFQLNVEVLFSYLRTPSPTPPKSGHLHGVICFPSLVIHFYRRKGWWCCGVFQGTGKGCGWCGGTSCGRFGWLCEQHIRRNKRVSNISELNTFSKYVIFFVLSRAWEKEIKQESPRRIESQTFGFRAPMFNHWASESSMAS